MEREDRIFSLVSRAPSSAGKIAEGKGPIYRLGWDLKLTNSYKLLLSLRKPNICGLASPHVHATKAITE